MAAIPVQSVPHFEFAAGPYGADDLRVLSFHGTEGISELFRYDIVLGSREADLDLEAVVGQDATLAWRDKEGDRWVHGIICRFEHSGRAGRFSNYQARLVPKVWLLTMRQKSRIFQNKAAPDIVKEVLDTAGVASDLYELRLSATHKPREYCVQYGESDWAFASRLMEEEGIFYFFEHTEDSQKLVIADVPSAHEPVPWKSVIPFREAEFGVGGQEEVSRFRFAVQVRQGAVMLRDFDFKKPSLQVENTCTASTGTELEWYDYPGEYHELSVGKDLAEVRLQEFRAERNLGLGEGNCTRIVSGYKITLEDHPSSQLNQEYLIVRAQHWCSQPQAAEEQAGETGQVVYHNTFECIPSSIPYRPRRWTPRPRIDGLQSAIVVGPPGEEIHTDEYGRVKVQFHWDLVGKMDEKSSCWIRVSQGWAGQGWGMIVIPRIGQEVIVDFLEGDPDQPLIVGRVYNGENPPPYGLPGAKTKSTWKSNSSPGGGGSNEIRFEDASGREEVFLHAQKDWNIQVLNNESETVGANISTNAGGNISRGAGANASRTAGQNISDKAAVGISAEAGKDIKLQAGGSYQLLTNLGIHLKAMNFVAALIENAAKQAADALKKGATSGAVQAASAGGAAAGAASGGGASASGAAASGASAAAASLASAGAATGQQALAALAPAIEAGAAELRSRSEAASKGMTALEGPVNQAIQSAAKFSEALSSGASPEAVAAAFMSMAEAAAKAWDDAKKVLEGMLPQIPSIVLWAMKDIQADAIWSMSLTTRIRDISIQAKNKDIKIKGKQNVSLQAEKKDIDLKAKKNVKIEAETANLSLKATKKDVLITGKEKVSIKAESKELVVEAGTDKVTIKSGKQIFLQCGSASISMAKSGNIVIKGAKINVKGSGPVQVNGNPIKLN